MKAEAARGDFAFVVANDLHYRDERCGEWFEAVVKSIRSLKPRPEFVLLNGDLSDVGTRAQLGAIREIFHALPVPVHNTIGNHDYGEGDDRAEYDKLFGPNRNLHFRHRDHEFICLDTTDGRPVFRTWVHGETLGWLDANLRRVRKDHPVVVFSHFPLCWNWLRPVNAGDVTSRLGTVRPAAMFCGHWHGLSEQKERGMPVSIGRCCSWWRTNHDGSDLKGYFLCTAQGGQIRHEFIPVELPRSLAQQLNS